MSPHACSTAGEGSAFRSELSLIEMTAIYLDYNASTPVDPRVNTAMQPLLEGAFGSAMSAGQRPSM